MSLRLRPVRGSFSSSPGPVEGVYQDLLDVSPGDREVAVDYLVRRGLDEGAARRLRPSYLGDYAAAFRRLRRRHGSHALARAGLLSRRGNLLFYRHRVLLPVRDGCRLASVAGLAFDSDVAPAALVPRRDDLSPAARRRLDLLLARLGCASGRAPQLSLRFAER